MSQNGGWRRVLTGDVLIGRDRQRRNTQVVSYCECSLSRIDASSGHIYDRHPRHPRHKDVSRHAGEREGKR